jgi:hypothetical protein
MLTGLAMQIESVSRLIDKASEDEDVRQELWVRFLTNSDLSTFSSMVDSVQEELAHAEDVQLRLKRVYFHDNKIFELFTPVEAQLVTLLIMGYPIGTISVMMGIKIKMVHRGIEVIRARVEDSYVAKEIVHRA